MSDRDELLALNAYGLAAAGISVDGDYYMSEDFEDLIGTYTEVAGGAMVVGEAEGRIVAMGGIRRLNDGVCELLRMRVYPHYQRRGYATDILQRLEEEARRFGYRRIELLTGESQEPAVGMYTRHGYQPMRRETLLGIPSMHMAKEL